LYPVLPSGKRLHNNHGKSPFLFGKSTISMGHFPVRFFYVYRAGYLWQIMTHGMSPTAKLVPNSPANKNHQLVTQDQWVMAIGSFKVSLVFFLYFHHVLVGGCFNPSEKYEFVSWDDYSQYMKWKITNVPNHQPVLKQWMELAKSPSRIPSQ